MSENNNEQFKMPPKRPRGPMGRGPGMVTEKARDFKGSTKKLINISADTGLLSLQL